MVVTLLALILLAAVAAAAATPGRKRLRYDDSDEIAATASGLKRFHDVDCDDICHQESTSLNHCFNLDNNQSSILPNHGPGSVHQSDPSDVLCNYVGQFFH